MLSIIQQIFIQTLTFTKPYWEEFNPLSPMRKGKLRDVKQFAEDHTAVFKDNWNLNSGRLAPILVS